MTDRRGFPPATISPRRLVEMGNACLNRGDYTGALVSYDLAQAIQPESAEVALMRALALLHLGRAQESLDSSNRSLSLSDDRPSAHTLRGVALIALGRYGEALHALDRALELNPTAADAMYNQACAHSLLGDGEQALAWLIRAVDAYPDYRSIAPNDPNLDFLRNDPALSQDYRLLIGD